MRTDYLKLKARRELLAIQAQREREQDEERLSNPENWQKPRPTMDTSTQPTPQEATCI